MSESQILAKSPVPPVPGHQTPRPPPVGPKFDTAGHALPFLGNTIVCPLPAHSVFMQRVLQLHAALSRSSIAEYATIMPPTSLHMTVFEGVLDIDRSEGNWPADLPAGATLTACHRLFTQKMQSFDMGCDYPFRMRVSPDQAGLADVGGFVIYLEPVDAAENRKLRGLRDRLAGLLRLHHPDHADYRFHSTQAFLIDWPTREAMDEGQALIFSALDQMRKDDVVLELPRADFCFFDDLMQFRPRVALRRL